MTVPTQPVTVRLADFGGASVAGVRVTAKLSDFDYTADGTFVGTEPVSALTDATGTAVLYVFPNQLAPDGLGTRGTTIKFSAAMPGSKSIRVDAVVPNHACDLVNILVSAETPPFTAAQLFEQRANNAAALAEARMPVSSDTPPANPVTNRLWFNTTNGKTYQWFVDADGGQWVETSGFYYVDDPVSVQAALTARTGAETAQGLADTAAETAAQQAGEAAASATASATSAGIAQLARSQAEAARDQANSSGRAYLSTEGTAAALADAAVLVGQTFAVVALDGLSYNVYRKDAGPVATSLYAQVTKAYIDSLGLESSNTPDTYQLTSGENFGTLLQMVLDDAGRLAYGVDANGDLVAQRARFMRASINELVGSATDADSFDYSWGVADDAGNVVLGVVNNLLKGWFDTLSAKELQHTLDLVDSSNYTFAITDDNDNVVFGVLNGQIVGSLSPASVPEAAGEALQRSDLAHKAFTARVQSRNVLSVQRPICKYNIKFVYGQSLAQGDETWPALSRTNRYGNLMLGGNVMPTGSPSNTYTPFGSATLQPLFAQTVLGSTQYDATGEAALTPGTGARGEPVNHGWANGSKFLLNQRLYVQNDPARLFVSVNVASSGATIGELSKNHTEGTSELYGKYSGALSLLATARGADTWGVDGIAYMQGEHDYFQASGHNSLNMTYAAYKAKLVQLCADMQADAVAATGQELPPAFLIYQTGAAYTRDVDANGTLGLHIGMAQLDFAVASKTAWMVGPVYPYTDKGGHLDSNGSRWFGHQIAKVYHRVVVEGRDWQPLRAIKLWRADARTIYIGYHVPAPPLVFDSPYVVSNATLYAAKGFRVRDTTGDVTINAVDIVNDTTIKITLARDLTGTDDQILIWYAGQQTYSGNGNVRDSDSTLAADTYVYEPERGMYAAANIPALVGKPYPLYNWSVAFCLPLNYSEI